MTRRYLSIMLAHMFMLLTSGCSSKPDRLNSRLNIDSGSYVTKDSRNRIPAVYWLGMCTATAVSHNTIVFAAHCTDSTTGRNGLVYNQICIQRNLANADNIAIGKCADKVFIHPQYFNAGNYGLDLAVAVFPPNTFQNYFAIETSPPMIGSQVLMAGFSAYNLDRSNIGSKRWGYNQIQELDQDNAIVSSYQNSQDSVAVSPGDSGGPLFSNCKVVGTASRMSEGAYKSSLHTNLTIRENSNWMMTLARDEGAIFCGLSTYDNTTCKLSELGGWNPALKNLRQTEEFPCAPSSIGAPNQSVSSLYLALGEMSSRSAPLHVASAALSVNSVKICIGEEACTNGINLTVSGRRGEISFFGPTNISISNDNKVRVDAFDQTNQLIETRIVRFVRR